MKLLPLGTLLRYYRARLRRRWWQELLAGTGIAAGVALMFSVAIANSSITSSARAIMQTISGDAQMQLSARGPLGADQRLVSTVASIPGVRVAAPLLEQRATLREGSRRVGVDLVGVDPKIGELGGITSTPLIWGLLRLNGVFLPSAVADALRPDRPVALEVAGKVHTVAVTDVLDERMIGDLGSAMIAGAELRQVQLWSGMPGRVSRIIVLARAGSESNVRAALDALAAEHDMDVSTLDDEIARLEGATAPNDQATALVAAVGVLVGLLLAYTAMSLTAPERRQLIAQLRVEGWTTGRIAQRALFPALMLGLIASAAGIALGYVLTRLSTHSPPGYLAFAFPLGTKLDVKLTTVLIAAGAGVLVSVLAAAQPLLDLRSERTAANWLRGSNPGHSMRDRTIARTAAASVALVIAATIVVVLAPATTVAAVVVLAVAALLALPALSWITVRILIAWPRRDRPSASRRAAQGLRATSIRSIALSATAALAVFGAVAILGARSNLLNGLYEDYREYVAGTDIWITQHGDDLALQSFTIDPSTLADVPGVAAVRSYQGGLTDLGRRRVWLIARSKEDPAPIPPSQVLAGDVDTATEQLRAGRAVTLSQHVADQYDVGVGDTVLLPTPTGDIRRKVAAITTNLGWGPGAVIVNLDDYQASWGTTRPTAIEIDVQPGQSVDGVIARVRAELGDDADAVRVQSVAQRADHANALAREGLARLGQIATLLVVAAGIALAAAMSATIWQRRATYSQRAIEGFPRSRLWRIVLIESAVTITIGCVAGALAGAYGHWLLGRWLQSVTGYPAPYDPAPLQLLAACSGVAIIALAIVALPGYIAVRAPARIGVEDA